MESVSDEMRKKKRRIFSAVLVFYVTYNKVQSVRKVLQNLIKVNFENLTRYKKDTLKIQRVF